jgi:para-nitrobenzyl esterase
VWTYRSDWAPPGSKFKACHCIELPFLFDTLERQRDTAPMIAGGDPAEMASLGTTLRQAWIGFVRDGEPGQGDLSWPAQQGERPATLCFDRDIHILA